MQKNFFEILVLTALTVDLIWTILELTPKSALLSLTILHFDQANMLYIKSHVHIISEGFGCILKGIVYSLPIIINSVVAKNYAD